MKKKVLSLDFEFECDFSLIAISTIVKDYKICAFVNQKLKLSLSRKEDIELLIPKKNITAYYALFSQKTEHVDYHLISNKYQEQYLVPELKLFQYFLMFKGFVSEETFSRYMKLLNEINDFALVKRVNPDELKSKENLMIG